MRSRGKGGLRFPEHLLSPMHCTQLILSVLNLTVLLFDGIFIPFYRGGNGSPDRVHHCLGNTTRL